MSAALYTGEAGAGGGGGREAAQDKYDQFYNLIVGKLDLAAGMKLTASAVRKGDKIDVKAEVADLKDTGMSVRLRLEPVEAKGNFEGGNGIGRHTCVVAACPAGPGGR